MNRSHACGGSASAGRKLGAGPPTQDEVATAIAALARGKSERVEAVQAELLQLLDEGNQEWGASEMRRWWANEPMPKRCMEARVVNLNRRGTQQELGIYHPVSLLIAM